MNAVPHSRPWITEEEVAAVARCLAGGMIGQGRETEGLEAALSEWVGGRGGVAAGSGSAALAIALRALGCGPGDEVIIPTYACRSILEAVESTGAGAVFCDAGEDGNVPAGRVADATTRRTRAAILPHLYGVFAETRAWRELSVPVVEDFAQALGPRGRPGIAGRIAVYSFHPTKCLSTGEGGMAVATDPADVATMRAVRDGSRDARTARLFSPLSDVAAALGRSQLARYEEFLRRRNAIAARYDAALAGGGRHRPWPAPAGSMHFRYPVRTELPFAAVAARFAAQGVTVRRGVDELLHRLRGLPDSAFPAATRLIETTVSLPIHPGMSETEIERCVGAAAEVFCRATG